MNLPGYGAVGGMSSIHSSTLVTVIRSSANDWKNSGDQQRPWGLCLCWESPRGRWIRLYRNGNL